MAKVDVFTYTDYRKFLQDWYAAGKKERALFSHRFIAQKVGFRSSGYFSKILAGRGNISGEMVKRFAHFLKVSRREAAYFETMVYFNQAESHAEKQRFFEEMTRFKSSALRKVEVTHYEYYAKWYYTAIRELLHFRPFDGNYPKLAAALNPPITQAEARKSIQVLERLAYIRKDAQGRYVRSDNQSYSTGIVQRNLLLDQYQISTLDLAKEAIDSLPRNTRNISTLTFSFARKNFPQLEDEVRMFRKRLLELAEANQADDTVYQFNAQVFPLTRSFPAGGKP